MATEQGRWVPAITIESTATVEQRQRNCAFYQRIRDGVEGDYRQGGLKQFVFEVPVDACTVGGRPPMFTFRIAHGSECYDRLCRYIVEHTDSMCAADDEVKRLRDLLAKGVAAWRSIDANVQAGLTTEEQAERDHAARLVFAELAKEIR